VFLNELSILRRVFASYERKREREEVPRLDPQWTPHHRSPHDHVFTEDTNIEYVTGTYIVQHTYKGRGGIAASRCLGRKIFIKRSPIRR